MSDLAHPAAKVLRHGPVPSLKPEEQASAVELGVVIRDTEFLPLASKRDVTDEIVLHARAVVGMGAVVLYGRLDRRGGTSPKPRGATFYE